MSFLCLFHSLLYSVFCQHLHFKWVSNCSFQYQYLHFSLHLFLFFSQSSSTFIFLYRDHFPLPYSFPVPSFSLFLFCFYPSLLDTLQLSPFIFVSSRLVKYSNHVIPPSPTFSLPRALLCHPFLTYALLSTMHLGTIIIGKLSPRFNYSPSTPIYTPPFPPLNLFFAVSIYYTSPPNKAITDRRIDLLNAIHI